MDMDDKHGLYLVLGAVLDKYNYWNQVHFIPVRVIVGEDVGRRQNIFR